MKQKQQTLPNLISIPPINLDFNANHPPSKGQIKSEALRLRVPEIEFELYARAQWLIAHKTFGDSTESKRAILAQYSPQGYEAKDRKGRPLFAFHDDQVNDTFTSTVRQCEQSRIPEFEQRYFKH